MKKFLDVVDNIVLYLEDKFDTILCGLVCVTLFIPVYLCVHWVLNG